MTMLAMMQQRTRIRRELSRRIGYTNGLHDIFRFARLTAHLHRVAPASVGALRSIIIDEEGIKGQKYAEGVIDVARALGLVHKTGSSLTLTDRGYALYAVQKLQISTGTTRALLLYSILESDGDATLNLLDIIASGADSTLHGELLVERLLGVLEYRKKWAEKCVEGKVARDVVLQELTDSRRRLSTAVDLDRKQSQSWSSFKDDRRLTAEQRLERFYSHTVNPRRRWLRDLGCIQEHSRHRYEVTNAGRRILRSFRDAACYSENVCVLPPSADVSELLGVGDAVDTRNLFWKTIASYFVDPGVAVEISPDEYFQHIVRVYPYVRFHLFNEAAIVSVHDTLAAEFATTGRYLEWQMLDQLVKSTLAKFPDRIFRLRQRHGGSGYIAIRGSVE